MKKLKDYEIGIAKLSNKKHLYEFEMDDSFFDLFGKEILQGGNLKAKVELDKTESLLTLTFAIQGDVKLICDRSLEEFEQPVDLQEVVRMRFGPENKELDDDLWEITPETQHINVAQHLYDFIALSLPMKKLHPRFLEEQDEDDDDDILIYSSRQADQEAGSDEDGNDDEDTDPRWDALKNLN
ncbi:YceD family protein [Pontibacter beigongshangensis]|uniref:YceD family protein n=1 Tax=Pontibacter beigongshangensis TaxID=2574733 RepID=UPI00164EE2A1|nr:YceD family protein [Pontibacter beigongshangensis]